VGQQLAHKLVGGMCESCVVGAVHRLVAYMQVTHRAMSYQRDVSILDSSALRHNSVQLARRGVSA
jgi:hypothetical protein